MKWYRTASWHGLPPFRLKCPNKYCEVTCPSIGSLIGHVEMHGREKMSLYGLPYHADAHSAKWLGLAYDLGIEEPKAFTTITGLDKPTTYGDLVKSNYYDLAALWGGGFGTSKKAKKKVTKPHRYVSKAGMFMCRKCSLGEKAKIHISRVAMSHV